MNPRAVVNSFEVQELVVNTQFTERVVRAWLQLRSGDSAKYNGGIR